MLRLDLRTVAAGAWATPAEVSNGELARLAFAATIVGAGEPIHLDVLLQAGSVAACPQVLLPWMLPAEQFAAWERATQPHRYAPRMTANALTRAAVRVLRSRTVTIGVDELVAAPGLSAGELPSWIVGRGEVAAAVVLARRPGRKERGR